MHNDVANFNLIASRLYVAAVVAGYRKTVGRGCAHCLIAGASLVGSCKSSSDNKML